MRKTNLSDLVKTLESLEALKKDYIVPASKIVMRNGSPCVDHSQDVEIAFNSLFNAVGISSSLEETGEPTLEYFDATNIFHEHLAEKVGIPYRYYERMLKEKPTLLDENVNSWLKTDNRKFMLRSINGKARALLSDRYQALDHLDVIAAFLSAAVQTGYDVKVEECDLTEKRMYIRVTCPQVEVDATNLLKNYRSPKGDPRKGIISGLVITNSETGYGAFTITPRAVVLACSNGLIRKQDAFRKIHIGGQLEKGVVDWSSETHHKAIELCINQAKDAVSTFLSKEYVGKFVSELEEKAGYEIKRPTETIEKVSNALAFTSEQRSSIMKAFIEGGDNTSGGVMQALTYFAQQVDDADMQHEIELQAVDILDKVRVFDNN